LQCVEHVVNVEERFLGRLGEAERAAAPRTDPTRESELAARVTNRAMRAQAPDPVKPTGRFASLRDALSAFNATRERTISFARDRAGDLAWLVVEHPRFGNLNGSELLLIMAGHALRHSEQIRETRAAVAKT
jgi:hypothetical protein